MFRVKNRDKQPQFFDKHLSKTRKIQFRILMRSDALWYSDHSSSDAACSRVRGFLPTYRLAAYCSNTFHSNCLANHSLSTRIRNSSRKNLLIPKQRWRRMIKQHAAKSRNAHLPDAILNSAQ